MQRRDPTEAGWEPFLAVLTALALVVVAILLAKEAPLALLALAAALAAAGLARGRALRALEGSEDPGLREETLVPPPRRGGELQVPTGAGAPAGTRSGSADQTTR